jgi:hypothetical protein
MHVELQLDKRVVNPTISLDDRTIWMTKVSETGVPLMPAFYLWKMADKMLMG